jgi:TusA-related sulfurtransferase
MTRRWSVILRPRSTHSASSFDFCSDIAKYPTPGGWPGIVGDMSKSFASEANQAIDITGEVCPMTFVRTKLRLERMRPGEVLSVRLRGEEPLRNVPRAARDEGHVILGIVAVGDVHIVTIRSS